MHTHCIAQGHMIRYIFQSGIKANGEKLNDFKVGHLGNVFKAGAWAHVGGNIETNRCEVSIND